MLRTNGGRRDGANVRTQTPVLPDRPAGTLTSLVTHGDGPDAIPVSAPVRR
jgi:hypothetical protein